MEGQHLQNNMGHRLQTHGPVKFPSHTPAAPILALSSNVDRGYQDPLES